MPYAEKDLARYERIREAIRVRCHVDIDEWDALRRLLMTEIMDHPRAAVEPLNHVLVWTSCKHCGSAFQGYVGARRYCGDACAATDALVDVERKTIQPPPQSRPVARDAEGHTGWCATRACGPPAACTCRDDGGI